jgi:hypothetical protein
MNDSNKLSKRLRRAAMTMAVSCFATGAAVHANPSNNIIVLPPTALPALAQQAGEAMLLRDMIDGRSLLYVEQEHGARLAIFDVTDPAHIKGEGSVQLSAAGAFDFLFPIGNKQELIEYRQGHEDVVLDFRNAKLPNLKAVQSPIARLGNDALIVASGVTKLPPAWHYQVVDTTSSHALSTEFEVAQVRERISKTDTGTTFLLANDGLYVVRRPAVEGEKRRRDEEWFWEHTGN